MTTVAAATFRRAFQAVELGNGVQLRRRLHHLSAEDVHAADHGGERQAGRRSRPRREACFAGTLDPAKVAGKIVVCERGVNARIDKSFEVKRAGGVGMVLVNPGPNSLNGDYHPVPSVHLNHTDGDAVEAYAATPDATAKIGR